MQGFGEGSSSDEDACRAGEVHACCHVPPQPGSHQTVRLKSLESRDEACALCSSIILRLMEHFHASVGITKRRICALLGPVLGEAPADDRACGILRLFRFIILRGTYFAGKSTMETRFRARKTSRRNRLTKDKPCQTTIG